MKVQRFLNNYGFIIFFILGFINLWPYLPAVTWITESLACLFFLFWMFVQVSTHPKKPLRGDIYLLGILLLAFLGGLHLIFNTKNYSSPHLSWILFFVMAALSRLTYLSEQPVSRQKESLLSALFYLGLIQVLFSVFYSLEFVDKYIDWIQSFPLWFPHLPKTEFASGTMFQKNHFSSILLIFAVILSYFHAQGTKKNYVIWMGFVGCAYYLAQSASRLVLVQLIFILGLTALRSQLNGKDFRQFKKFSFFFLIAIAFQIILSFTATRNEQSALQRLQGASHSDYRWTLWSQAWDLINKEPLQGSGIGTFAMARTENLAFSPLQDESLSSEMYHHSHNWILQILIDHGWIVGSLLILLFCYLMLAAFKNSLKEESAWTLWLSAWILFVHSFTEYPLWYLSFFMLLVFCLNFCLPQKRLWSISFRYRPLIQMSVIALIGFSAVTLYQYVGLATSYYQKDSPPLQFSAGSKNPMLKPMADFYQFVMKTDLNDENLKEKLDLCEKVKSARPVEYVYFKCSILFALDGNIPEALEQLQASYHMFPQSAQKMFVWISQPNIPKDPRLEVLRFRLQQMIMTGT